MTGIVIIATMFQLSSFQLSDFADTEASTNIVLDALGEREIAYAFKLEIAPSVSNNVELSFGDGTNFYRTVGWDAGIWKDVDCMTETETIDPSPIRNREWRFRKRDWPLCWTNLRVTSRGTTPADPVITISREQEFLYIRIR